MDNLNFVQGVIVAKSRKYNGYCLVIYSFKDKKFYRIISKSPDRKDGELIEEECRAGIWNFAFNILDEVRIPVLSLNSNNDLFQKENLILNGKIDFLAHISIDEFVELYKIGQFTAPSYIFANCNPYLEIEEAKNSPTSFLLVIVNDLRFNLVGKNSCKCSFKYNNQVYQNFSVTIGKTKEEDINTFCPQNRCPNFYTNAIVGFSFGHPFTKDQENTKPLCFKFLCSFLGSFDFTSHVNPNNNLLSNQSNYGWDFPNSYISEYIDNMIQIQKIVIDYLEAEDDVEEKYENLNKFLHMNYIHNNKSFFKSFLYLISNITNNHYHTNNFYKKIEKILLNYKDTIKQFYTNMDIFNIFKKNKRMLLFLINESIIIIDEILAKQIKSKKFIAADYDKFLKDEISPFIYEELQNENVNKLNGVPKGSVDNRNFGQNQNRICRLIRRDLKEEFINYINENHISLNKIIDKSIYETNSFLLTKNPTLIEYAAFFGSVNIFNYLITSNVQITPSICLYAVHGNNIDILKDLENKFPNQNESKQDSQIELLIEAIKCHHNSIAEYFINKIGMDKLKNDFKDTIISACLHYHNIEYIKQLFDIKLIFFYACKYDHYYFFIKIMCSMTLNVNYKIIF